MAPLNLALDLAGLALWLNWIAIRFDPLARAQAASLVATLKKADPVRSRRWRLVAGLLAFLALRGIVYWEIGGAMDWTPGLDLGIIHLSFRNDDLGLMLLFSLLSFGLTLAVFYLWLLVLSVVNRRVPDADPLQKLVRLHLKWVERRPPSVKVFLPFLVGGLLWLALHPMLARLAMVPETRSSLQLFEQAAFMGAAVYLAAKYLIVGILVIHLVSSYVYLGNHPIWNFVNASARRLLLPLSWLPLRVGKVDFLPLVGIALVFLATEFFSHPPAWPPGLRPWFYHHLPF